VSAEVILQWSDPDMPIEDPEIQVVSVLDKDTCLVSTYFLSSACNNNEPSELWLDLKREQFWLYHTDEYYNERLRKRRNAGIMISQREPRNRLVQIGVVHGVLPLDPTASLVLAEAHLRTIRDAANANAHQ